MTVLRMTQFIDMAIKDEASGEAFYKTMTGITDKPELKAEYEKIANQEHAHMEAFQKMKETVTEANIPEEYAGQYETYMNTFLTTRAFPDANAAVAAAKNAAGDLAAMEIALRMEKDTLLLYHEVREFIPESHKQYVNKIIEEERMHISTLANLKERFGG